jgi:hypothetical protein
MSTKYIYTSSEDVLAVCLKRRGLNIVSKELTKPNESYVYTLSQMLQRKGLKGTTVSITADQNAALNGTTYKPPIIPPLRNKF